MSTVDTLVDSATSKVKSFANSLISSVSTVLTENMTGTVDMPGLSRTASIPSNIRENLLSPTSKAADCFVNQYFSAKLQGYMVGYVSTIMSGKGVYGG